MALEVLRQREGEPERWHFPGDDRPSGGLEEDPLTNRDGTLKAANMANCTEDEKGVPDLSRYIVRRRMPFVEPCSVFAMQFVAAVP